MHAQSMFCIQNLFHYFHDYFGGHYGSYAYGSCILDNPFIKWYWMQSTRWRIVFEMKIYLEIIHVSFLFLFVWCSCCNELKYVHFYRIFFMVTTNGKDSIELKYVHFYRIFPISCDHEKKLTCPLGGCNIVAFVINVISNGN